jgi:3-oxoacyl-[acyl-carrier-protein] synthase II
MPAIKTAVATVIVVASIVLGRPAAAGAAELAITCLAIRDAFIPPTLNLSDPDPACDLDGTPLVGVSRQVRAALKISIGFGGHLAVAVLNHWEESPRS